MKFDEKHGKQDRMRQNYFSCTNLIDWIDPIQHIEHRGLLYAPKNRLPKRTLTNHSIFLRDFESPEAFRKF